MIAGSYPWERAARDSQLFCDHSSGRFSWSAQLSADCVDLLEHMLTVEPAQRATLPEVESHHWMTDMPLECGLPDCLDPASRHSSSRTASPQDAMLGEGEQNRRTSHTVTEPAAVQRARKEVLETVMETQAMCSQPRAAVTRQAPVQPWGTRPPPRKRQATPNGAAVDAAVTPTMYTASIRQPQPVVLNTRCVQGEASTIASGILLLTVMVGAAFLALCAEVGVGEGFTLPPLFGMSQTVLSPTFLGATLAVAGLVPFAMSLCHLIFMTNKNMVGMTKRLRGVQGHVMESIV